MEFFLHLWDEIDDVSAAFRHITVCAVDEIAHVPAALGAAVTALSLWLARLPG